jgi:hypothetical protein
VPHSGQNFHCGAHAVPQWTHLSIVEVRLVWAATRASAPRISAADT